MDGICSAILNKIYALGETGRYFIISEDEFFESFPSDSERDAGELRRALKKLEESGYLDIRYNDGDLYCVALLKTYAPEPEEPKEVLPQTVEPANAAKSGFFAAFAGGAAGGALGAAVVCLLFMIF